MHSNVMVVRNNVRFCTAKISIDVRAQLNFIEKKKNITTCSIEWNENKIKYIPRVPIQKICLRIYYLTVSFTLNIPWKFILQKISYHYRIYFFDEKEIRRSRTPHTYE